VQGLEKALHRQRFRSIDGLAQELQSSGWSAPDGTMPADFADLPLWLGKVLWLGLRIDTRRVPAGAAKVRRLEAEARERTEVGARIPPERRREIRDRVEAEMLQGTIPSAAVVEALWDTAHGDLLLSTTADAGNGLFRGAFRETFGRAAEPLTPDTLARRLRRGAKGAPLESIAAPGPEFLLWLWFQTETEGGAFDLGDAGRVGVAFDQVLELCSPDGSGKVTVRGDLPTRTHEADSALKAGRLPQLARLVLARDDDTFEVTLDGRTFDLRSVKVPALTALDGAADAHEADTLRAAALLDLARLLTAVYARYLDERLAAGPLERALPALVEWQKHRRVRPAAASA